MKIVCISDTHNRHSRIVLPKGDVLLHTGDITESGTVRELFSFLDWFSTQNFKHKIFIAGNHDFYLQKSLPAEINKLLPSGTHYLCESGVEINGKYFWGSPFTPTSPDWAFGVLESEISRYWKKIPKKTDILITHTPPYDILDKASNGALLGSPSLLKQVERIKPELHVFGHLHDNFGKVKFGKTTFINATSFTGNTEFINAPIEIEL